MSKFRATITVTYDVDLDDDMLELWDGESLDDLEGPGDLLSRRIELAETYTQDALEHGYSDILIEELS